MHSNVLSSFCAEKKKEIANFCVLSVMQALEKVYPNNFDQSSD